MFEWKVEDLSLMSVRASGGLITSRTPLIKSNDGISFVNKHSFDYKIYPVEETLSMEEKIDFIERIGYPIRYALEVISKSSDIIGEQNNNTVEEWISNNDPDSIITKQDPGLYLIRLANIEYNILTGNIRNYVYNNFVDDVFNSVLRICEQKEISYCKSDEYNNLAIKIYERFRISPFYPGVFIIKDSGLILRDLNMKSRVLTLEEMKFINDAYYRLDELAKEVNKIFDEVGEKLDLNKGD